MSHSHPRSVRRGNTSGLIGLWNQKAMETEHSGSVDADSLRIREEAARRISVRDPPRLSVLEVPDRHGDGSVVASVGGAGAAQQRRFNGPTALCPNRPGGSSVNRFRKTSEIVRPTFKIKEEEEDKGVFAAGIVKEKRESVVKKLAEIEDDNDEDDKTDGSNGSGAGRAIVRPAFSFIGGGEAALDAAFRDVERPRHHDDDDDDDDCPDSIDRSGDILKVKELQMIVSRERRRGSKTTDDIKEEISSSGVDFGSGIGSNGKIVPCKKMGRSKSVKVNDRVKFGVMPVHGGDDLGLGQGRRG